MLRTRTRILTLTLTLTLNPNPSPNRTLLQKFLPMGLKCILG